ncbi:MAG: leucyl aminopeptidase [Betaproteobacteria bacterium]|nr:leucyl aminopeptidase [Betaproteobacteria bacterium]
MDFSIKAGAPEKQKSPCIVLGYHEDKGFTPSAAAVDKAAKGHLKKLQVSGDLSGRAGAITLLHGVPGTAAKRVMLVGLGKASELQAKAYRDLVSKAIKAMADGPSESAVVYLAEAKVLDRDEAWCVTQLASVATDALYRFDRMKGKPAPASRLKEISLGCASRPSAAVESAWRTGAGLGAGVSLAKDLGNLPSNVCTPTYLADQARALAKSHKLKVQVLDEKDIAKLKMGSFLAVTQGTREPAKFIVLEYQGAGAKDKPVVLVGKGITFDTGGISLKPSGEMDEMKYDMSGAGSVLGTLDAVARCKLPINVVGLIPTCENMPGGAAIKPGDVVTSMAGITIEILNTDAEGRLILCDALTYAERFEPQAVIDIATLTGACVVALGSVATGLYSNDDTLASDLLEAGQQIWDRAWHMPLWDDYHEQIKSPFADLANVGGRPAGSVTAACFLARFAKKYKWAHLDIAGTAWRSGKDKGSTGRPVPMLFNYLARLSAK